MYIRPRRLDLTNVLLHFYILSMYLGHRFVSLGKALRRLDSCCPSHLALEQLPRCRTYILTLDRQNPKPD